MKMSHLAQPAQLLTISARRRHTADFESRGRLLFSRSYTYIQIINQLQQELQQQSVNLFCVLKYCMTRENAIFCKFFVFYSTMLHDQKKGDISPNFWCSTAQYCMTTKRRYFAKFWCSTLYSTILYDQEKGTCISQIVLCSTIYRLTREKAIFLQLSTKSGGEPFVRGNLQCFKQFCQKTA